MTFYNIFKEKTVIIFMLSSLGKHERLKNIKKKSKLLVIRRAGKGPQRAHATQVKQFALSPFFLR